MRIVHFSDWHFNFEGPLPGADLYICTGDMYANYSWELIPYDEKVCQEEAAIQVAGLIPSLFTNSPNAPIVCVRGNHDFTNIGPLFANCRLVHEFKNNELIEVHGLKITGHQGIPEIGGAWNDEMSRADLMDRVRAMPMADIYVTHYPPSGILDSSMGPGLDQRGARSYGLEGLADFLLYRNQKALHCFGHIHEWGGKTVKHGDVTFSNAATTHNVIEF